MKKAMYAGSFDCLQNGHLWMIREGAELFDELHVLVAENVAKNAMFTCEERVRMLQKTICLPNVVVDTASNEYTALIAKERGIQYLLRGIRSEPDYQHENLLKQINNSINPDLKHNYLMPPTELSAVSSSIVKGLAGPTGWIEEVLKYAPMATVDGLISRMGRASFDNFKKVIWNKEKPGNLRYLRSIYDIYQSVERNYHTLYHIEHCLQELEEAPIPESYVSRLEIAIWFHDIFQNPVATDNEERSTKLAFNCISDRLLTRPPALLSDIEQLIMSTKHKDTVENEICAWMADIDLSMLGQSWEVFKRNSDLIRKEYAMVEDSVYTPLRIDFLKKMIRRGCNPKPYLFHTEYFHKKYNDQAIHNMDRLITELGGTIEWPSLNLI